MIGIGIDIRGGGFTRLPFRFTINTNNTSAGSSTSTQFKLPLVSSGTLNAVVNWGDGTSSTITAWNQAEVTHTYAIAGLYDIRITGVLRGWQFNNGEDRLKILNIINWSGLIIDVSAGFYGCTNLTASAIDAPTITGISLTNYFRGCSNFNSAVGNWNVANVNSFSAIFSNCVVFNNGGSTNINNWQITTSSPVDMEYVFQSANSFNQPINSWNTSTVNSMRDMFINAFAFNQPIGNWNVSNVVSFQAMFFNATAFNQDIGAWNVSKANILTNFMAGKTAANYSAANLDSIYNGWSSRPVLANKDINFGSIKYTAAGQAGKDILDFAPNNWTITDGGI